MPTWKTMQVLVEVLIQSDCPVRQTALNHTIATILNNALFGEMPLGTLAIGTVRTSDPRRKAAALKAALTKKHAKARRLDGATTGRFTGGLMTSEELQRRIAETEQRKLQGENN